MGLITDKANLQQYRLIRSIAIGPDFSITIKVATGIDKPREGGAVDFIETEPERTLSYDAAEGTDFMTTKLNAILANFPAPYNSPNVCDLKTLIVLLVDAYNPT